MSTAAPSGSSPRERSENCAGKWNCVLILDPSKFLLTVSDNKVRKKKNKCAFVFCSA